MCSSTGLQWCRAGVCVEELCARMRCMHGCHHSRCLPPVCLADSDCLAGYWCDGGACVYDRCAFMRCVGPCRHSQCLPRPCGTDADCPDFQLCNVTLSVCMDRPACAEDSECGPREWCSNSRCVEDLCAVMRCAHGCVHSQCLPARCTEDSQCRASEWCNSGECVADACIHMKCTHGCAHSQCLPLPVSP
eukprot:m51a1_g10546 hypothetical protein (190) ;mRNA; r:25489-26058